MFLCQADFSDIKEIVFFDEVQFIIFKGHKVHFKVLRNEPELSLYILTLQYNHSQNCSWSQYAELDSKKWKCCLLSKHIVPCQTKSTENYLAIVEGLWSNFLLVLVKWVISIYSTLWFFCDSIKNDSFHCKSKLGIFYNTAILKPAKGIF